LTDGHEGRCHEVDEHDAEIFLEILVSARRTCGELVGDIADG
jgi:hypothetical protein